MHEPIHASRPLCVAQARALSGGRLSELAYNSWTAEWLSQKAKQLTPTVTNTTHD